ncbi:hypothetical protein EYF80_003834 [Liparis tanakae]|uniref:Uncharacterized protein n=1 Tax=Liparis tanakae TaxID=230148 RepID=A0A4Z2J7B7_9TELE|nr:hypothetical protein EYF80_003834 [Liparis tanakae]
MFVSLTLIILLSGPRRGKAAAPTVTTSSVEIYLAPKGVSMAPPSLRVPVYFRFPSPREKRVHERAELRLVIVSGEQRVVSGSSDGSTAADLREVHALLTALVQR